MQTRHAGHQPRPQGSLLSCAGKIATPGQVQRHYGFEWLCKRNRSRPEPIGFVRLDSEHAQSDGKSVNRGLPELDLARGCQRSRSPSNEIGWALVAKHTCARETRESTGNENTGYRISRALCLAFLNVCFHWISHTLKPKKQIFFDLVQ